MEVAEHATIALTVAERKHRLPFGAQKRIAEELGVSRALVSAVVGDKYHPTRYEGNKTLRRIQVRVARQLGLRVDEAFPVEAAFPKNQSAA